MFAGSISPLREDVRVRLLRLQPDVLILDLGSTRNLLLAREISIDFASVRLITLASDSEHRAVAYAEAGVVGFLMPHASPGDVHDAIHVVAAGGVWGSPRVSAALASAICWSSGCARGSTSQLSRRETQVIQLVEAGLSNREIGEHLSLGLSTVKNHIHNILDKLGASTRGEAVALWVRTRSGQEGMGVIRGPQAVDPGI